MSSKPAWLLRDPQLQKQAGVDFKSAENFRSESNGKKSWYVTLGLCCSHQVQSTHPVYRCPACTDLGVQRARCVQNSHCGHGVLWTQLLLCAHILVCMDPHVFMTLTMCIDFHMCMNLPMHRFPRVHSSHYTDPCLCKLPMYEWIPIICSSYCAHGSPLCTSPTVCTDPHLYIVYCALFPSLFTLPSCVYRYMCADLLVCMNSPICADPVWIPRCMQTCTPTEKYTLFTGHFHRRKGVRAYHTVQTTKQVSVNPRLSPGCFRHFSREHSRQWRLRSSSAGGHLPSPRETLVCIISPTK